MERIFVPTISGTDWQHLLAKPKLHWKRGYSAMSAAACWEDHAPNLPPEIKIALDASEDESISQLELLAAIPEWKVDLPGGDRPSQTDILALTRNEMGLVILGVEAKVDETFGPTLGEKKSDASSGQVERIAFLEEELGSPFDDAIRYQLLHRTVSTLLTARAFHAAVAVMLVQSFSQTSKWRGDFDAFVGALNGNAITPDLFELGTDRSPRLIAGWCTGDEKFLSKVLPSAL